MILKGSVITSTKRSWRSALADFFGLGYGLSRQKFAYLPEVVGDSIFAVIAEEMGFVIAVGLLALFVAFVWRGLKIAAASADSYSKYLCVGIISWIAIQAFVNIGSMTSILPMTGVTLPFVSYGGNVAGSGFVRSGSDFERVKAFKERSMKIMMTGGGTLGPVTPLLAVIEAWRRQDPTALFVWVGTKAVMNAM